jgi:hypothetical protein
VAINIPDSTFMRDEAIANKTLFSNALMPSFSLKNEAKLNSEIPINDGVRYRIKLKTKNRLTILNEYVFTCFLI